MHPILMLYNNENNLIHRSVHRLTTVGYMEVFT
uniref:Uncharacterized protein n=1 Tax=Anguilla anguilla TaxID=7936 RepID=A0A0E9R0C1_ANGAN